MVILTVVAVVLNSIYNAADRRVAALNKPAVYDAFCSS